MRMHPAVGTLHRIIEQDYTLPNGGVAPKGTYVIIPAVAFHNDPGNCHVVSCCYHCSLFIIETRYLIS